MLTASARADRILLIPLDGRPAAGQFAQMIGRIGGVEVTLPPYELLGRYTQPGDPDAILEWLANCDPEGVIAVVVSTDMIAYGGLIASRTPSTPLYTAQKRIARLATISNHFPKARFYAYSAIMRLYPTATRSNASWRLQIGRYMELKDRYRRTRKRDYLMAMRSLLTKVPPTELRRYEQARARDHQVQRQALELTKRGTFDYCILGQDDAKPFGPHVPEQRALRKYVDELQIGGLVYLCEGIDQHANVLVSRALLRNSGWLPRVRVVFSDNAGKGRIANYESKSIELSLQDQLLASGARPVAMDGNYDYTLFLNTPEPRKNEFQRFADQLGDEVDQGFPAAVADINLGWDGTGDPKLFAALEQNDRMFKLLAYAGWNTAGNTMGTTIPAANVYLLARKLQTEALQRETAQKEFLLHRFVNDFQYHKYVRPAAYKLIDSMQAASRDELFGGEYEAVSRFVQKDLGQRLESVFTRQFLGRRFFAGTGQFEFSGLDSVQISLPWPRAYEVRLGFRMLTKPLNGK